MKPIIFLCFCLSLPYLSLSQQVDSIKVFYLPWKFNVEGEITENLVRDYPNHSDSITITDQMVINDFLLASTLVSLRPQRERKNKFISKMVIDVYQKVVTKEQKCLLFTQTIYLDSRQNILFSDRLYYKSFALENWLNKYVFQ